MSDWVVIPICFTRSEATQLRNLMHLEGEQHLSQVLRKRLGFASFYRPPGYIFAEDLEELDSVRKIITSMLKNVSAIGALRHEVGMLNLRLTEILPKDFTRYKRGDPENVDGKEDRTKPSDAVSAFADG